MGDVCGDQHADEVGGDAIGRPHREAAGEHEYWAERRHHIFVVVGLPPRMRSRSVGEQGAKREPDSAAPDQQDAQLPRLFGMQSGLQPHNESVDYRRVCGAPPFLESARRMRPQQVEEDGRNGRNQHDQHDQREVKRFLSYKCHSRVLFLINSRIKSTLKSRTRTFLSGLTRLIRNK